MDKIALIQEAIEKGKAELSNLTPKQFEVGGFTSPKIRHIMNNLGAISANYLECGSHIGCSLIMTTYGNDNLKTAVAIDNWSEFNNNGRTKKEFLDNCEKNIPGKYQFIEKNCFKITEQDLPAKADLYLYDAAHDYESQKEGITHFVPLLADEFILMVDDTAWNAPIEGTNKGIQYMRLTILYETFLYDGKEAGEYWNGFSIFLLKK